MLPTNYSHWRPGPRVICYSFFLPILPLDYAELVTKYSVHWTHFFTLGILHPLELCEQNQPSSTEETNTKISG